MRGDKMIHISEAAINALKEKYYFNEKETNVRIFIKGIG